MRTRRSERRVIAPSDVSAVVVTRGDVDMSPVVESLACFADVNIWDNSREQDLAVYGRYAALDRCCRDVVFVQDDDVILPPESIAALCSAYEPGVVVCNMPQRFRDTGFYRDHALVGFGAVFDKQLPDTAFARFLDTGALSREDPWEGEAFFNRTCDIVFTALTPHKLVDVPYADREFASDHSRMWRQAGHVAERTRMLDLVRKAAA